LTRQRLMNLTTRLLPILVAAFLANLYAEPRVIILGFDGAEPTLLEKWMDAGELPNLNRLREEGCYSRLRTTNPAESPVSWSCFETGLNPGKTNIFDFLKRRQDSYHPEIALTKSEIRPVARRQTFIGNLKIGLPLGLALLAALPLLLTKRKRLASIPVGACGAIVGFLLSGSIAKAIPSEMPVPILQRKGTTFWEILGKQGIRSSIINAPVCFPPTPFKNGRLLCGLGTPDLRRTWGTFFCFRDDISKRQSTETGGILLPVVFKDGAASVEIPGPRSPFGDSKAVIHIPLKIQEEGRDGTIQIKLQQWTLRLKPGEWTDLLDLTFPINLLFKVKGIARFRYLSAKPFQLYLSPIQLHPKRLPTTAAISFPKSFSGDLVNHLGLFETVGWPIPTNPLKDETIDEDTFLENLKFTERNRRRILFHELEKNDWQCLFAAFMGPDRIQHMFWRFIDEEHALYDADQAKRYGGAILEVYKEIDEIVGRVIEKHVDEHTTLMLLSDHGFHSFRKGVNLNTWLVRNGFMTLSSGSEEVYMRLEDLFDDEARFFKHVDWSKTKAYSLGLGKIYLNVLGREPEGSVLPGPDYETIRDEIINKLKELKDPDSGVQVVRRCYKREEIYSGNYADEAADIIIGFEPGYRVSWQTAAGGIPKEVIEVNRSKWSGAHCSVDPEVTPGVFLSNRQFKAQSPHITDLTPTILKEFGIEPPKEMDGKALSVD